MNLYHVTFENVAEGRNERKAWDERCFVPEYVEAKSVEEVATKVKKAFKFNKLSSVKLADVSKAKILK